MISLNSLCKREWRSETAVIPLLFLKNLKIGDQTFSLQKINVWNNFYFFNFFRLDNWSIGLSCEKAIFIFINIPVIRVRYNFYPNSLIVIFYTCLSLFLNLQCACINKLRKYYTNQNSTSRNIQRIFVNNNYFINILFGNNITGNEIKNTIKKQYWSHIHVL